MDCPLERAAALTRIGRRSPHLKEWRVKFADHLPAQGVAANGTPRLFRDQSVAPTPLAIHWRDRREQSKRPAVPWQTHANYPGRETYAPRTR
jgi:hypothetical protein